jgi:hypothetical protein
MFEPATVPGDGSLIFSGTGTGTWYLGVTCNPSSGVPTITLEAAYVMLACSGQ